MNINGLELATLAEWQAKLQEIPGVYGIESYLCRAVESAGIKTHRIKLTYSFPLRIPEALETLQNDTRFQTLQVYGNQMPSFVAAEDMPHYYVNSCEYCGTPHVYVGSSICHQHGCGDCEKLYRECHNFVYIELKAPQKAYGTMCEVALASQQGPSLLERWKAKLAEWGISFKEVVAFSEPGIRLESDEDFLIDFTGRVLGFNHGGGSGWLPHDDPATALMRQRIGQLNVC